MGTVGRSGKLGPFDRGAGTGGFSSGPGNKAKFNQNSLTFTSEVLLCPQNPAQLFIKR